MRKLILMLFLVIVSYANDELKIYERVLPSIFDVDKINVFASGDLRYTLSKSKHFKVVSDCNDALILMGKGFKGLPKKCLNKPLFATNYITFKKYINSFGAFYWRKARPQLRFKKDVLKKFGLKLPRKLYKYAR